MDAATAEIQRAFHEWYYMNREQTWEKAYWCGVPILKNPMDLWILQELITRLRPGAIIETGTHQGGSALYYAMVCDVVAPQCWVLTIDQTPPPAARDHPRVLTITGDSVAPETVARVTHVAALAPAGPRLVLLDSDHSAAHVLAELRAYSPLVTPGSYVVVEDTNLGHQVVPDFGPGPAEGLAQWLAEDSPPFGADPDCERLGLTWSPGGYLRRREGP